MHIPLGPTESLISHLQPGEKLLWQLRPGATPLSRKERITSLGSGLFAAAIGTTLAGISGEVPDHLLPVVFASVTFVITALRRRSDRLSPTRLYAITDQRVLIMDGGRLQVFPPDQITYLDVRKLDDGTVDLVWGDETPRASNRHDNDPGGGARLAFVAAQRKFLRGFLGLPSAEPPKHLIDALRQAQSTALAEAVPEWSPPASAAVAEGDLQVTDDGDGWQTIRQPELGFAIDLPATWQCRTAKVKRIRLLGLIPFEVEPRWSETPKPGWNRLEVDAGIETVALTVSLNPEDFPEDLPAVLNDPWAKRLNLTTLESEARLRIGSFEGFSVLRSLKGAGIKFGVGPVKIGVGGTVQAELLQLQLWLRRGALLLHVTSIAPADGERIRQLLERIVRTVRVG